MNVYRAMATLFCIITPATIYVKPVIPAKTGIQKWLGCRIKSGMTVDMFNCWSNNTGTQLWES